MNEPVAGPIFAEFEQATGIRVEARYDIEASKSVGLAGRLEAEAARPRADVWWGVEPFLTARLANEHLLAEYRPPTAADVSPTYRDPAGRWTGTAVRARVLAVANPLPAFPITGLHDLLDPRLSHKIAMAYPTAGATGAHVVALYLAWGTDRADAFFRGLHDNGVTLLGGNAEVADQTADGAFAVGLTDSDAVANAAANTPGGVSAVVPDQGADGLGTLAMPTTIAVVASAPHADAARQLVDFLASKHVEDELLAEKFATWSVRERETKGVKAMDVDYREAARLYTATLERAINRMEGR